MGKCTLLCYPTIKWGSVSSADCSAYVGYIKYNLRSSAKVAEVGRDFSCSCFSQQQADRRANLNQRFAGVPALPAPPIQPPQAGLLRKSFDAD